MSPATPDARRGDSVGRAPNVSPVDELRKGTLLGCGRVRALGPVPAVLAAARARRGRGARAPDVWSLVVVAVLVAPAARPAVARPARDRHRLARLAVAAVAVAVDWGLYIYGVTSDQDVETALGYYINPLVRVFSV